MTKMLGCKDCKDVILLYPEGTQFKINPRTCKCGECYGCLLLDKSGKFYWHALLFGPAIALGIENDDKERAFQAYAQKDQDKVGVEGYHPVRVYRIPDGDRIIIASKTDTGWKVTTPCWRCGLTETSGGTLKTDLTACEFANIDLKKYEGG